MKNLLMIGMMIFILTFTAAAQWHTVGISDDGNVKLQLYWAYSIHRETGSVLIWQKVWTHRDSPRWKVSAKILTLINCRDFSYTWLQVKFPDGRSTDLVMPIRGERYQLGWRAAVFICADSRNGNARLFDELTFPQM